MPESRPEAAIIRGSTDPMRVLRQTEQQFVAEEKPLTWASLLALFALAAALLLMQLLNGRADWQSLAAGLVVAVSGYHLLTIKRVWLVLDRSANAAELHRGRARVSLPLDVLAGASVQPLDDGTGQRLLFATRTAAAEVTLTTGGLDPARLQRCAAALNAWLAGAAAPAAPAPARPAALRLDSDPALA